MANRLLELESSLAAKVPAATRPAGHRQQQRARRKTPPAPTPGPSSAAPGKRAPIVRAAGAVDFRVRGIVDPVAQPSSMTCWATVASMMLMWREQASMTIPTAIGKVGTTWLNKFTGNQGLETAEKATFLAAAGFAYEYPQSLTAEGWEALLRRYGPLWVTTDEKPGAGFSIHARIMTGIHGDGTPGGTTLDIVDPDGGKSYKENFGTFLEKYESEARESKRPLRIQIVHWPQDAGFQVARSQSLHAAAYAESLGAGRFATVDEAEFEPKYNEANPERVAARAHSSFAHGLASPKAMTATDVHWAADADSIDYRHLATAIDTQAFSLTGAVLDRLVQLNSFGLDGVEQKVVFGLRGCTIDANAPTFVDAIAVREIEPNHIDNRCLIGVWDRTNNKIAVFAASTVPNWEYMETYRQHHGKKANLLPTGRYLMVVGTHRPKKKNAAGALVDNPLRVQGALRNDQEVAVLRSEDDLTFTVRDTWDQTVPNDNIHAGIVGVNPGGSTTPDYSSAGCNTVPGTSVSDHPDGSWAEFRGALGFDNTNPTKHDGKRFAYVLLTGREARMCASRVNETGMTRLRFGSHGDGVRALQDALSKHPKRYFTGTVDGDFAAGTAMAVIKYQKARDGGAADGIVTPTDATALGFSFAPTSATGVRQMDLLGKAVDFARGILKKFTKRPEEGRFAVTSDQASLMHDDTPVLVPWKHATAIFAFRATSPDATAKDVIRSVASADTGKIFKLMIDFEYNGFDIRDATIHRQIQGSSEMKGGKFTVEWKAQAATKPGSEVSQIDFLLNGKWDPGLGNKFFDFSGKLWVRSDGSINFELSPNERVKQELFGGKVFTEWKVIPRPAPTSFKQWHAVFFSPAGSDKVSDTELQLLKDWLRSLQSEKEPEKTRYRRLREGQIPVNVEGYASATGKGQMNQDLSTRRADRIVKLLQLELSTSAKIVRSAHGEENPGEKKEVEDFMKRRVEIWFDVVR